MDADEKSSVDSLLDQLKNIPRAIRVVRNDEDEVTRDNLEQFILKQGTTLVKQAAAAIEVVKDYVESAPNADDVAALSELIRAQGTALSELNKMFISDQRNQTAIKLRKMDNDSRSEQTDKQIEAVVMLTREEAFKQILAAASSPEQKALKDRHSIEVEVEAIVEDSPELVLDNK